MQSNHPKKLARYIGTVRHNGFPFRLYAFEHDIVVAAYDESGVNRITSLESVGLTRDILNRAVLIMGGE